MPGLVADTYKLCMVKDVRNRDVFDHLCTADLAREMSQAPADTTWRWQQISFAVPEDLGQIVVVARADFRDWAKVEKEAVGDANARQALLALRPKKPRQLRERRIAARPRGRGRGRGRCRGAIGIDPLVMEEAGSDESDESTEESEHESDEAADPAVPEPPKLSREKIVR